MGTSECPNRFSEKFTNPSLRAPHYNGLAPIVSSLKQLINTHTVSWYLCICIYMFTYNYTTAKVTKCIIHLVYTKVVYIVCPVQRFTHMY